MSATPFWLQLLQAFATPLIGLFVAYVAWRQWRIAQEAQKERLFERRYDLFQLLVDCRVDIFGRNKISDQNRARLMSSIEKFRFLFGKEIEDYVQEFYRKSEDLREIKEYPEIFGNTANKENELRAWFDGQREDIYSIFSPFLGFESPIRPSSVFSKLWHSRG